MHVHRVEPRAARQRTRDADHRLAKLWLTELRSQRHASRRQRDRAAAERRVGVSGRQDRVDLLMRAVELQRLLIRLRVEPVEEHARASPNGCLAVLERRPGDAAARPEVNTADRGLIFRADAPARCQVLPRAVVVLRIETALPLGRRQMRIADVSGERRRHAGLIRGKAREGERTGAVADFISGVLAALDEETGAQGMLAGRDLEVVREFAEPTAPGTRELRAA